MKILWETNKQKNNLLYFRTYKQRTKNEDICADYLFLGNKSPLSMPGITGQTLCYIPHRFSGLFPKHILFKYDYAVFIHSLEVNQMLIIE